MKNFLPLSKNEFELFQKLLIEESGLYFDKERSQSLRLALWERLQKRKCDSYQEYYNLLKFHPQGRLEIRELLDLITVGETYFFRNRPQFEALMRSVLPEIIQTKMYSPDKSIRIWSAGCSKGDEPYSIAIATMEVLPSYKNWNISILGTDINRKALIYSKEAIYKKKDVLHLPREYLDKYFDKKGTGFVLRDKVKELVRFESHNLAKPPFTLEGMQEMDIIFCRNVTIYFDFQTTKRVIDNFYDCLAMNGYLFPGHAETLWQVTNKFETVEFPQAFIYKKASHPVQEEAMKPFMSVPEIKLEEMQPLRTQIEEIEPLYEEATRLFNEKKYPEAISLFDKIIAQDKNHIRAYFAKATILANQAKYQESARTLARITEVDNLYIEAYYLLGVLSYKMGDFKAAETQFRKVIYIEPEIVLPYFNLGNIYLYQRKFGRALREFKNAIKLLENRPKDEQVGFCKDFTVESLLRACENSMEEIGKK